ncbi:hypothetical protein [Cohnella sp. CIP 111063]|uniref:hypothetical protein n=1 Tax=unclassified Cohnella TaxID=2636738 RepID=UPI003518E0FB
MSEPSITSLYSPSACCMSWTRSDFSRSSLALPLVIVDISNKSSIIVFNRFDFWLMIST